MSAASLSTVSVSSPTCDAHVVGVEGVGQAVGDDGVLQGHVAHLHPRAHLDRMGGLKGQTAHREKRSFSVIGEQPRQLLYSV